MCKTKFAVVCLLPWSLSALNLDVPVSPAFFTWTHLNVQPPCVPMPLSSLSHPPASPSWEQSQRSCLQKVLGSLYLSSKDSGLGEY